MTNSTDEPAKEPETPKHNSFRFSILLPWLLFWNGICATAYFFELYFVDLAATITMSLSLLFVFLVRLKPSIRKFIVRDGADFEEVRHIVEIILIIHALILCLLAFDLFG